jgi:hypothetical protein
MPLPGDPELAAAVAARMASTGVDEPHAVIAEVLLRGGRASPETVAMIEGTADRAWTVELGRRLGLVRRG